MDKDLDLKWVGVSYPKKKTSKPLIWGYVVHHIPVTDAEKKQRSWGKPNNDKHLVFWGFVGGQLTFKEHSSQWTAESLVEKQKGRGYEQSALNMIVRNEWPNFEEAFKGDMIAYKLSNY